MKKNILRFFLFLIISIVSFSASYNIDSLDINAFLKKDGSMEVHEQITYDIGEINGIYFDIDAKGFGGISSLEIFEDMGQDDNGKYIFEKVDSSRYEITENDGLYKVKLYSKNSDNTRVFYFKYTLPAAATVYDDVAQLNRKMVGQNWEQSIGKVFVRIELPVEKDYDNSKIHAFGHGPLIGEVDIIENSVEYSLLDYYPGDFIEADILMETNIFSEFDKSKIIHKNMRQELLDMEANLAEEANIERENALKNEERLHALNKKAPFVVGAEASIWAIIMYYIHIIFKRKNKFKGTFGKYLRELPDDSSPALVGGIITKTIDRNEILASIVDLIRRKILTLDTIGDKAIITLTGSTTKLSAQEKIILDIYMNDFGDGKSLDLQSFGFFHKVPYSTAEKFEKWKNNILNEMNRKNLNYEGMGCLLALFLFLLGVVFFFGGILQSVLFDNPIFMPLSFLGAMLLVSILKTKRPNDVLAEKFEKWNAFKNFLSDYSQLEEAKITSVHLWEQYFVYAIALGVSDKVVKAYKRALDMGEIQDVNQNLGSLAYSPIFNNRFYNSFNNLSSFTSKTYSRSNSTIAASRSSSSFGRGGGFSSGSSGGGGSRGGGGAF